MAKNYAVFECADTVELCRQAREKGFETWVPMEEVKRVRRPKNKSPYIEVVRVCAMPGYIYVPFEEYELFHSWAPFRFRTQLLLMQGGSAGISVQAALNCKMPAKVPLSELKRMDDAIKGDTSVIESDPNFEFKPGDRVEVVAGVFRGLQGRVSKVGKKGVAVGLGPRIAWFSASLIQYLG